MVFDTRVTRFRRRLVIGLLALSVVGYFGYHTINGNHGIIAFIQYEDRVAELNQELSKLRAERQKLENRVALLRSDSIDPDMLEERVRETLSMAHPNDVVILKK